MDGGERLPDSSSLPFIEGLYADYLSDPQSVPPDWREYFASLDEPLAAFRRTPRFKPASVFSGGAQAAETDGSMAQLALNQERVGQLVRAFRIWGHLAAQLDPLQRPRPAPPLELDPAHYGFSHADLNRRFSATGVTGAENLTLNELIERLRHTYCRSIGVQFMHISDAAVKRWLQERMEATQNRLALSPAEQRRILTMLTDATIFEQFIQKKYLGAKRFSLEGAESLIPLLQRALDKAGAQKIRGVVIGMPHRGRLNVLVNIIGKSAWEVFREFEDIDPIDPEHRGDVKYHLGYNTMFTAADGKEVHVSLCFNPSHLEYVNPMALGRVRANQDRRRDRDRRRGLAILIHGDAAFAGEGIVQETLNLSELEGYRVGGTVHVVVNNQLGFTTDPEEDSSGAYTTDVALMLESPVFHVNGEDPEAVAQVINLAMDFRQQFQRDVVIDMYCYRRYGHNEGDEPAFTQPLMYQAIAKRRSVREGYLKRLIELGDVTVKQADALEAERRAHLEAELAKARESDAKLALAPPGEKWSDYQGGSERDAAPVDTAVPVETLAKLLRALARYPKDFKPHPKLVRFLKQRREMAVGKRPLDWAAAEALALASLAAQGVRVRLTGQDSERGTFSQRHAVLHDQQTGARYYPFAQVARKQAPVEIHNSPLSEAGVLGFEYGYCLDNPDALVLWEAQFGDFSNVAQVIIDQFIASAEDKWDYLSGLTLLLPHGFEGLGPEHSSARLERFLMLAANDNMQIVNCTTPAQYFHVLRRQALRRWRKPLIVMTPKSLLRHPAATASLDELAAGGFTRILPDALGLKGAKVKRVLISSGKIYYELAARREELRRKNVAILRLEQLYPLEDEALKKALKPYPVGTAVVWVQEEPENMGAWRYLAARFGRWLPGKYPLSGVYRPAAPSPATGSARRHREEQEQLISQAFTGR